RQLEKLEEGDADDVDWYLEEHVFWSDADEIVVLDAYPRNAGMASGIHQELKALRLATGATIYHSEGEWEGNRIRGFAAGNMDDEAAAAFGEVIALPTYFYAGDDFLELDRHLSAAARGGWIFEALIEHDAEWITQKQLDRGE